MRTTEDGAEEAGGYMRRSVTKTVESTRKYHARITKTKAILHVPSCKDPNSIISTLINMYASILHTCRHNKDRRNLAVDMVPNTLV